MGLLTFLDTTIDKVFAGLKSASQNFPQLLIIDISPLRIVAAVIQSRCSNLYRLRRDELMHQYL